MSRALGGAVVLFSTVGALSVLAGCGGGKHHGGGGVAGVTTLAIPAGTQEPRAIAARQSTDQLVFTAFNAPGASGQQAPVVVSTTKSGKSPTTLATGGVSGTGGVLVEPVAMVLSKDEGTIYVADVAAAFSGDSSSGAIFTLPIAGGTPTVLSHGAIDTPTGITRSSDGATLFVTGRDPSDGQPAVFSLPSAGGTVTQLAKGSPLTAATGISLSSDGTKLFVADQNRLQTSNAQVYSLPTSGGALTALAPGGLGVSTMPGNGVLARGDGNVVVSTRNGDLARLSNVPERGGAESVRFQGTPFVQPFGLASDGGRLFVADGEAGGTGLILVTN